VIAAPAPRDLHAPGVTAPTGLASRPSLGALWEIIAEVPDPEIPVISVVELGILRGIEWDATDPPRSSSPR
jgi:metal-sulfur cluster biosynthetic enzyme